MTYTKAYGGGVARWAIYKWNCIFTISYSFEYNIRDSIMYREPDFNLNYYLVVEKLTIKLKVRQQEDRSIFIRYEVFKLEERRKI